MYVSGRSVWSVYQMTFEKREHLIASEWDYGMREVQYVVLVLRIHFGIAPIKLILFNLEYWDFKIQVGRWRVKHQ